MRTFQIIGIIARVKPCGIADLGDIQKRFKTEQEICRCAMC
ncbi:MAG TPA: hypothetical protein VMY06_09345 [Sedimentisphaerales bacterium]|nr:hypothetical protein [Sedimentisphaerales bacterium]